MSSIKSYVEKGGLKYSVTIGRKTFKGFDNPQEALKKGIEIAQEIDPRSSKLVSGKPLERQVGIIFGAETQQRYFGQPN